MSNLLGNKYWQRLRKSVDWGARRTFFESIVIAFVFPLIEAYLVNVWTGAADAEASIARNVLVGVAVLHLVIGTLILAGERQSDVRALADAAEAQDEVASLQQELHRRQKAYAMVTAAVDEFNRRTCAINPWCQDGFEAGLRPIVDCFTRDIAVVLGVTSNRHTVEVHLVPDAVYRICNTAGPDPGMAGHCMEFMYASHVDRSAPMKLTHSSPVNLAMARGAASVRHVSEDPEVFFNGTMIHSDVYFRRYTAVPFSWACSEAHLGYLVLTSDQDGMFVPDVLETLRFLASLIANYVNNYNRCAWDRLQQQVAEVPAEGGGEGGSPTESTSE